MLVELSSKDGRKSAKAINSKTIPASKMVAITPNNKYYVNNQDFTKSVKEDWAIEQIKFLRRKETHVSDFDYKHSDSELTEEETIASGYEQNTGKILLPKIKNI